MQSSSDSEEDSDEMGAPSAANYQSQSGGIVDALEGLLSKAESQLEDVRKTETAAANAYAMQKQSLDDKIKFSKKGMAATSETKATAAGDLDVTKKDLAADTKDLSELHHECVTEATNFEESTK